jgi:sulfate permease, SulP family
VAKDDSDGRTSSRTSRFLPGIYVLRHYRRAWLRGDLVAGCTVAAYLIPQVMAYAEVAGLPPVTGLWAVMRQYPSRRATKVLLARSFLP